MIQAPNMIRELSPHWIIPLVASLTLPPSFKDIPKLFSKDTGSKVVIDIFLLLGHIMGFP